MPYSNFPASEHLSRYHPMSQGQCKRHPDNKELTLHYEPVYKGVPVNVSRGPMVVEYMEALIDTYVRHANQFTKRFIVRVDLYFPPDWSDAQRVSVDYYSRFMEALKARIETYNHHQAQKGQSRSQTIRFCRVFEQGEKKGLHIHALLMFNGHSFSTLGDFQSTELNMYHRLIAAWGSALGIYPCQITDQGLVHFNDGGYYLDHNDPHCSDKVKAMFTHCSYICKAYSKRYGLPIKTFSRSRG